MTAKEYAKRSARIVRHRRNWKPELPAPFTKRIVPAHLLTYAAAHQRTPTAAEARLYDILRQWKSLKWPIEFQYPMKPFIVDFVCLPRKLVIEVDGGYHTIPSQQDYDQRRSAYLRAHGYRIIRFTNAQIFQWSPACIKSRIRFFL